MSLQTSHKHSLEREEETSGNKKVRVDLKSLSDAQIKRVLLDKILRRKADHPAQYENAKKVCDKAYITWELEKKELTLI